MTAQTANKATVPVGTDGWKLTDHIKQAIETTRSIIPVANEAERDGLAATFPGGVLPVPSYVNRADNGNVIEKWDGSKWLSRPHIEFTYNTPVNAIPNNTAWGPGTLTLDTGAVTTDSSLATSPSSDKLKLNKGTYAISFDGAFGAAVTGNSSWFAIKDAADQVYYKVTPAVEFWGGTEIPNFRVTADNTVIWFRLKQNSGGATNSAGRIRITRIS